LSDVELPDVLEDCMSELLHEPWEDALWLLSPDCELVLMSPREVTALSTFCDCVLPLLVPLLSPDCELVLASLAGATVLSTLCDCVLVAPSPLLVLLLSPELLSL
jgi:hypothetical protein